MSARADRACDLAAAGVLVFAFAALVYRNAAQAITIDEATNFLEYARRPLSAWIAHYDANNHALHTLLCRYSVRAFGASEFAMRLPGLLGAALFFAVVFRLSRDLFSRAWMRPLAAAALALNPFTLDYLSAARGYGLALSFFFWALFLLFRYASGIDPRPALVSWAAVALALSVASNLVFAFVAVGLALVFTAVVGIRRFWWVVDRLWGPAIVLAFAILVLPLSHMSRGDLYYGAQSLLEMYDSLIRESSLGLGWGPLPAAMLIVVLLGALAAIFQWARARDFAKLDRLGQLVVFAAGTMAVTLALLIAAHLAFGILYPLARTGLYFPTLAAIACAAIGARLFSMRLPARVAGIVCLALLGLVAARYAACFRTTYYNEWLFDAGSKRTAAFFGEVLRKQPGQRLEVGASWPLYYSLQFYAAKYKWDALAPQRMPLLVESAQQGEYPYYLLTPEDAPLIARRNLKVVYTDAESGAIIAAR